ncbi:MAG: amidohydrolase family protein [Thermomicrobiales bacterium]|nr:amidohydrolase family protein [Thermomicrobiales bacterium]MCO5222862.1 amidohydrolase family protein [Thermomicrobiales bacterium]
MAHDLVIRGGTIVTATETYAADVGITGETIAEIGQGLAGTREVDAAGLLVMPGGLDAHVHCSFWEDVPPDVPQWSDNFETGTKSAAAGGITSIGNMVFPHPGETMLQAVERESKAVAQQAVVDVFLHPVLTDPSTQPLSDIPILSERGHKTLKYFMSYAGFAENPAPYLEATDLAAANGMLTMIHCEDSVIIDRSLERLVQRGDVDFKYYPQSRPVEAEVAATARAVAFAENANAPTYIVHLSCKAALDEVRKGRGRGVPLWVETRPLYLYFTSDLFAEADGPKYAGQPPLREQPDIDTLWEAMATGEIDTLCTDHAPWLYEYKVFPGMDITKLRPGVADLETMLPMLWSKGVETGRLTPNRFVELISATTAKLFGLFPRKGTIAVGADADIVLWDPNDTHKVEAATFYTACDYSPFEGWDVTGWPRITISRGDVVYQRNELLGTPGRGQVLQRENFSPPAVSE